MLKQTYVSPLRNKYVVMPFSTSKYLFEILLPGFKVASGFIADDWVFDHSAQMDATVGKHLLNCVCTYNTCTTKSNVKYKICWGRKGG